MVGSLSVNIIRLFLGLVFLTAYSTIFRGHPLPLDAPGTVWLWLGLSGIIGFVGLLVPHMMRMLAGPDNRRLLPVSMLAGAILLLGADTLTRAVLPQEIPIGVLTALVGGPFFCYVFRRRQLGKA
jgi:ABC-type enterochelin transport system permease subunit